MYPTTSLPTVGVTVATPTTTPSSTPQLTPAHAAMVNFTKEMARQRAAQVKSAIEGLGTNDSMLIDCLCTLTNEQRYLVGNQYAALYGRSIKEDIKNDISGDYRKLILGICMPRIAYMAHECHRATKGLGTDEDALIDILSHTDTPIRTTLSQTFDMIYTKPLRTWLKDDTSFNFKNAVLSSLMECLPCNPAADAQALYAAGEQRAGTDDSKYIEILCRRTPQDIQRICAEYQKISKKSLYEAIKSETSGDYGKFLCAIVTPWHEYWAKRVYQSVHLLGTDDKGLIRAFVMNDRYTFPIITQIYSQKYKKTMYKAVSDDTSFNYKKALLKLIEDFK